MLIVDSKIVAPARQLYSSAASLRNRVERCSFFHAELRRFQRPRLLWSRFTARNPPGSSLLLIILLTLAAMKDSFHSSSRLYDLMTGGFPDGHVRRAVVPFQ
jgi:hypothetical protein